MTAMTKKKKQERIEKLKETIKSFGFLEDKWGNFKKEMSGKHYRFKIKKINIRFESKLDKTWFALFSLRIIKLPPTALKNYLIKREF